MARVLRDVFFQKAKAEGYVARSAFKLKEMQQRFGVIKKGRSVLDLGCSPGAWLQVSAQCTNGMLVGVDLQACSIPRGCSPSRTHIIQGDVTKMKSADFRQRGFDTILSDLCHKTTGIASVDAARSLNLASAAAELAIGHDNRASFAEDGLLLENGNLVIKVLEGKELSILKVQLKPHFHRVHLFRTQATRSESREIYVVGIQRNAKGDRLGIPARDAVASARSKR